MMTRVIFAGLVITFMGVSTGQANRAGLQGNVYALIINGISKDPTDRAVKDRVVHDLKTLLLDKGRIDSTRLTLLTAGESRADRIEEVMKRLASTVGREDRLLFYYIGQANTVAGSLRFNVVGEDVTGQQVAQWLNRIKAKTQLVVLDCPCAAMVAKEMTQAGRVVVFASTETQVYGTRFSMHFVPALREKNSDTNADGRISVLEAFTAAARGIEQWYRDRTILPTETPNLEDNADGLPSERPWRHAIDGGDGLAALEFILVTL